jgi:hypothetical protein
LKDAEIRDASILGLKNRTETGLTQILQENQARRQGVVAEYEQFRAAEAAKTEEILQQQTQATARLQMQIAMGVASAWSTAAKSMIDNSKSSAKAMLKAFVDSIKSIVMAYAAQASAAAMAANSGIPVIGIAVGIAAAGVAFAIVEAMIDKIPSARGGFDVPSGLNPLTQLHEREMVLPAQIADPLRAALATSGGMVPAPNIYISAIDGPSILKLVESPAFNEAIQENLRNGR